MHKITKSVSITNCSLSCKKADKFNRKDCYSNRNGDFEDELMIHVEIYQRFHNNKDSAGNDEVDTNDAHDKIW